MVSTVQYVRPQDPAEAAEFDAFLRMLPDLRGTHGGQYVAMCGGDIVASGVFLNRVESDAAPSLQGRAVYFGWVEPPEGEMVFIGGFTVLADASTFDGPNQVTEFH